jgi:hypothetical protein
MAAERSTGARHGRKVTIGRRVHPNSDGRIIVFQTRYVPDADPVSPELEDGLLNNASSNAMREILKRSIAEARGTAPDSNGK